MRIPHPLPAYCTPLDNHWPLPLPLPGAHLISTHFDSSLLIESDFDLCGVPLAKGVAKRQAEFLAGRLCAREALRYLTGQGTVPAVGTDRAPQWPAGMVGSITHSAGWAAAVVARRENWRGLGLDMEQLLSPTRADRLAEEILTPTELRRLPELDAEPRAHLVTLTFSLKESLFKALYPLVLRRFYFQDAELVEWREDGSARLRLLTALSADWPSGTELGGQFARFDGRLLSLVSVPEHSH